MSRDPVAPLVEFEAHGTGYAVRFAYDPFLVALIKKMPATERTFIPDSKLWALTGHSARFVAMVARRCGYTVTGIEKDVGKREGTNEFERNRRRVLSGETYRSGKKSDWRLGSSPSRTKERR
jgi:hypothetical protein